MFTTCARNGHLLITVIVRRRAQPLYATALPNCLSRHRLGQNRRLPKLRRHEDRCKKPTWSSCVRSETPKGVSDNLGLLVTCAPTCENSHDNATQVSRAVTRAATAVTHRKNSQAIRNVVVSPSPLTEYIPASDRGST